MMQRESRMARLTRRQLGLSALGLAGATLSPSAVWAAAPPGYDEWRDKFRARALVRGISDQTYTRVMGRIEPDMRVFAQIRAQPEFSEQIWQYINRRVSDWRLAAGKEALKENKALF